MGILEIIIIALSVIVVVLVIIIMRQRILQNAQNKENQNANNNKKDDKKKTKSDNKKDDKKKEDKKINEISKSDIKDVRTDFTENFLEFEEISDNMIIQNKGDKYVMVIKCQGINYDLMSEAEMISVEEGFIQFLNTLRFPIQLYIQTNSLDLTNSLNEYNERMEDLLIDLEELKSELKNLEEFDEDNFEKINELKYQIKKLQNVYEYGVDVVGSVEKISKSKSILQQTYYVIVPYYASELGSNSFESIEIKEMAFNELYTRCRGLIASLAVCSISGKILNSFELAELLYVAYNRDEGENYSFKNAIEAQYDRLYHTAPDVLDRKMAKIDQEVLEIAATKSNEEIIKASGRELGDVYQNNETIKQLVYENTKRLIKDYGGMINDEILQKATENLKNEYKEQKSKEKKIKSEEVIDKDETENIVEKNKKVAKTKKGGKK